MTAHRVNLTSGSTVAAGVDPYRWADAAACADRADLLWIADAHKGVAVLPGPVRSLAWPDLGGVA